MVAARIPANFFAMPFGLAGLGVVWSAMSKYDRAPRVVANALFVLAALVWLIVLIGYLRHALGDRGSVRADFTDPVASPFVSPAVITPMLLAAQGLFPVAPMVGKVLTDVFLALTVLLGSWLTSQWMYGPLDLDRFHPGYLLPTVAGGMVASAAAAEVGQLQLAMAAFGIGLVCWLSLGTVVIARLMFRPPLPVPLRPTLAIEIAPAATATIAYFAMNGDHIDFAAAVIGGYGLFMVLAQLRFAPALARLPFMPSTWSLTFTWAATATSALHWLHDDAPPASGLYEYLTAAVITVLIAGIALRTLIALLRGQLLPAQLSPVTPSPPGSPQGARNLTDTQRDLD
jgi:tellurite resistance protein